MAKAEFKTAYLQRVVPLDVAVVGSSALERGQLVTYTAPTSSKVGYIEAASTLAAATHIIALTDMTISDGHVPTDRRDYMYSENVAVTAAANSSLTSTSVTKKVGLYPIWDKADVVVTEA